MDEFKASEKVFKGAATAKGALATLSCDVITPGPDKKVRRGAACPASTWAPRPRRGLGSGQQPGGCR